MNTIYLKKCFQPWLLIGFVILLIFRFDATSQHVMIGSDESTISGHHNGWLVFTEDTVIFNPVEEPYAVEECHSSLRINDEVALWTNGCSIFDHQGMKVFDLDYKKGLERCEKYGRIGKCAAKFIKISEDKVVLVIIRDHEDPYRHANGNGFNYYFLSTGGLGRWTVDQSGQELISEGIDDIQLIRHGNNRDFWFMTTIHGKPEILTYSLSSSGEMRFVRKQILANEKFNCELDNLLFFNKDRSQSFWLNQSCGWILSKFDPCTGRMEESFSSEEKWHYPGADATFGKSGEWIYVSGWRDVLTIHVPSVGVKLDYKYYQKVPPGVTLNQLFCLSTGHIYSGSVSSDSNIHLIVPYINDTSGMQIVPNYIQLPIRTHRTFPEADYLSLYSMSPCDSLVDTQPIYADDEPHWYWVDQLLKIEFKDRTARRFQLIGLEGKLINQGVSTERIWQIDMHNFPSGMYFLNWKKKNEPWNSHKILK